MYGKVMTVGALFAMFAERTKRDCATQTQLQELRLLQEERAFLLHQGLGDMMPIRYDDTDDDLTPDERANESTMWGPAYYYDDGIGTSVYVGGHRIMLTHYDHRDGRITITDECDNVKTIETVR